MSHTPAQRVDITMLSIVKVFAVLLGIYLVWRILDILALLFVVLILVAALGPAVTWLTKRNIPRAAAVSLIYIGIFLTFGFLISLLLPPLIEQLAALATTFPTLVEQVTPLYHVLQENNATELFQSLSTELSGLTQGVFSATAQVFGGATAALTVLVLSFYLLLDVKQARDALVTLLPGDRVKPTLVALEKTGEKLGSWLRGQFILSVAMGLLTSIGLAILGVPYALTLGVLTGLLEIVPYLGPIIAALVTVPVAYAAGSWQLALGALVMFALLQQLENTILVPKIMQSAVGLSPVVVIIALAIGAKLGGVTGAIIAIPLTAVISVLVKELPQFRRH